MTTELKKTVQTQTSPPIPPALPPLPPRVDAMVVEVEEKPAVVKLSRGKRRKIRRQAPNQNKRDALKNNRKITAWKLAARKMGYFTPLTFRQLPKKGTPTHSAIMKERDSVLALYWRLACEATQHPELLEYANSDNLDKEKLKTLEETSEYQDVHRAQCTMLSQLITEQEKKQRGEKQIAWERALDNLGYRDVLENLPNRGTKKFKDLLKNPDWKMKYDQAKSLQLNIVNSGY